MGKVDMGFVREMARRATESCIRDFAEIQKGLPLCLRRPRRLSANRCRELRAILDQTEESRRAVYGRAEV